MTLLYNVVLRTVVLNKSEFFAGFYLALKDKNLRIEDRLKLLKYAWKSGEVFLPNKEQVLLDTLFGLLINKKK